MIEDVASHNPNRVQIRSAFFNKRTCYRNLPHVFQTGNKRGNSDQGERHRTLVNPPFKRGIVNRIRKIEKKNLFPSTFQRLKGSHEVKKKGIH